MRTCLPGSLKSTQAVLAGKQPGRPSIALVEKGVVEKCVRGVYASIALIPLIRIVILLVYSLAFAYGCLSEVLDTAFFKRVTLVFIFVILIMSAVLLYLIIRSIRTTKCYLPYSTRFFVIF